MQAFCGLHLSVLNFIVFNSYSVTHLSASLNEQILPQLKYAVIDVTLHVVSSVARFARDACIMRHGERLSKRLYAAKLLLKNYSAIFLFSVGMPHVGSLVCLCIFLVRKDRWSPTTCLVRNFFHKNIMNKAKRHFRY